MSLEPIKTFGAFESTEPQDIKTLTLSRRSLSGETVEQTEWVSREDYDRIKARAEKLEYLFKATERLALVEGGWEALSIGTHHRMQAEINRLREMTEWQPIATAPGYPTKILFGGFFKPHQGKGFWWQHGYKLGALDIQATVWMPEPKPPTE